MPERDATSPQLQTPDAPTRKRAETGREERCVVGLLLGCGALPWLGYCVLGAWDGRELALATLVLAFTLRGVFRGPGAPRRARRSSWTSST